MHLRNTLLGLCFLLSTTSFIFAAERPNIVVILVDDMGWSDIGCYGSEIPTPNLDALSTNGAHFSQFYNTGRCSPTRASLLTGHYPHQAGMGHLDNKVLAGHPGFQGKIADTSATIAEVLGPAGYFTAMTGKWHLGQQHGTPPWKRGFDRSLNLLAGGVHFSNQTGGKGGAKLYLNGEEKEKDDPLFGTWYGTDLWAEWGLKFIDEAKAAKKPFFLYVGHCAPHFPLMAPEKDIAKYRGKYLVGWDKLREARYAKQQELGLIDQSWALSPRADNTPAWDSLTEAKHKQYDDMMAIYAAMIENIDRSVGKIVAGLKERNELDNTLILFLSDNGGNAESGVSGTYEGNSPGDAHSNVFLGQTWATLNNTPFRKYKHYVHEGGSATPLIAHWPAGIAQERQGKMVTQPGHVIDIMPTCVELGEAKFPVLPIEPLEGISLLPAFAGEALHREQPIFFNHEDNRAVRDGKWKLVALAGKPWELYNMEVDRTELHDLAQEQPERVAKMADQYKAWAVRTHVVVKNEGVEKPAPKKKKKQATAE